MKLKCLNCGEINPGDSLFCSKCGRSINGERQKRRKILINTSVIISIIALTVVCYKNFLMPWQFPLFRDKMAVVEYVNREHPGSKLVEQNIGYRVVGYFIPMGIETDCDVTFEKDGFRYEVSAKKGKAYGDFHNPRKLENEVRLFIKENFLDPRGIENVDIYCRFSFNEYHNAVPEQWSDYYDSYTVRLFIRGQGTTIYDIDWVYDFYKFWKKSMIFPPDWYLTISLTNADNTDSYGVLYASYESNFKSKSEMYEYFY